MLTALQNLLIARLWGGSGSVVFPDGCVLITPNLEEGVNGMLDRVGGRTPICLIAPETADSDPEFDEEPDLQKFAFSVLICVTATGGAIGQETVMGGNVTDSTKSEGQGILAVEQEFFNAVGKVNALEGVIIQNIQRSEGGGSFKVPLSSTSYRIYRLEAWGTIGDASASSSSSVTTTTVLQGANQTDSSGVLTNITNLLFSVSAGSVYKFKFSVLFSSDTSTIGVSLGLTIPAFTVYAATVQTPLGNDGLGAEFSGALTSSGDSVVSTLVAVAVLNTPLICFIEGIIKPSASGTVQAQFAAETTGGIVTLYAGSSGVLELIT